MISKKVIKGAINKTAITAAMVAMTSISALAAEPVEIKSITLDIASNIDEKDDSSDVDVTSTSKDFAITDFSITNEPDDEWEDGDKPKLKIKIETDDADESFFSSALTKENVTINLKLTNSEGVATDKKAEVTKISRSGKTKAYIYVTLPAIGDGEYDLAISDIYWEDEGTYAFWEPAEDAKSYELKLYRNDKLVTSQSITTTDDGYDFSEYFTEKGDYHYKVRAVYNKSIKGEWEESEEIEITTNDLYSPTIGKPSGTSAENKDGTWVMDSRGWWWLNADRTWPANQWKRINNKDYYFNASGYMHTGWVFTNGNWYHCGNNGEKEYNKTIDNCKLDSTGAWVGNENDWFKWGKDWYYFGAKGKLVTNQWIKTNDIWYYVGDTGRMLTNTTTPDGYRVGADGAWIQ